MRKSWWEGLGCNWVPLFLCFVASDAFFLSSFHTAFGSWALAVFVACARLVTAFILLNEVSRRHPPSKSSPLVLLKTSIWFGLLIYFYFSILVYKINGASLIESGAMFLSAGISGRIMTETIISSWYLLLPLPILGASAYGASRSVSTGNFRRRARWSVAIGSIVATATLNFFANPYLADLNLEPKSNPIAYVLNQKFSEIGQGAVESIAVTTFFEPVTPAPKVLSHPPFNRPVNIFFFVIETAAARFFSPTSAPNLTALAKDSVVFPQAFANANTSQASWFSIFSSRYPLYLRNYRTHTGPRALPMLQLIGRLGFKTTLIDSANLKYFEGDQFFKTSMPDPRSLTIEPPPIRLLGQWDKTDVVAIDRLIEHLDHPLTGRNLFMIFPGATHFPYLYPGKKWDAREGDYFKALYSEAGREALASEYKKSISFVDLQIGRFIRALKARQLYESSVIVVTGDHGEEFMEHHHLGHGSDLSAAQTQVPLLMKLPGTRAHEETIPFSHVDIFPTLLRFLGIEISNAASIWDGRPLQDLSTPYPRFILTAQTGHLFSIPQEYVLTDGKTKFFFKINFDPHVLRADKLVVQRITDMNEQAITGTLTPLQIRNRFKIFADPFFLQSSLLRFDP